MKYTQIPSNTFQNIMQNAGILLTDFDPATGTYDSEDLIGATTGGLSFSDSPEYTDFGEDIDNCPKNTKELKRLSGRTVVVSGTLVTVDKNATKRLLGASDIDGTDATKIVPRVDLKQTDFETIWLVGDYSDVNTGTNAGFVAIKLKNALSTGGFSLQTTDREKDTFAFEFTAHNSISAQDEEAYEIYVKSGTTTGNTNTNNTNNTDTNNTDTSNTDTVQGV